MAYSSGASSCITFQALSGLEFWNIAEICSNAKAPTPPNNTSWVWQQLPDKFCIQCCSANEFQALGISRMFQVCINHTGTWGGVWFLTMPYIRYGTSSDKTINIHIQTHLSGMRPSIRVGYFTRPLRLDPDPLEVSTSCEKVKLGHELAQLSFLRCSATRWNIGSKLWCWKSGSF